MALGMFRFAMPLPIPLALGSHDALQAFLFGALGLGKEVGVALALVMQSADLLIGSFGGILLLRLGFDLLQVTFLKQIQRFYSNE